MRAVIFDMDGVLTDSEPLICAAAMQMFRELGVVVQESDFHPFVGAGEDRYIGGVAEKYAVPLDIARAKARTYELYLAMVPARLEAFPALWTWCNSVMPPGMPARWPPARTGSRSRPTSTRSACHRPPGGPS